MEFLFYARYYGYKDEKETVILASGTMEEVDTQANKLTEFQTASGKDHKKELWEPRWTGTQPA